MGAGWAYRGFAWFGEADVAGVGVSRLEAGRVRRVAAPVDGLIAGFYGGADLVDAYAIALPAGTSGDVQVLARAALGRSPGWVRVLLRVRDAVMGRLGVKTTAQVRAGADASGVKRIGFFPVLGWRDRELLLGENDRHLDFRASVLLQAGADGGREIVLTTVVHCRNGLGRVYLAVIRPFHVLVVRAMLRGAARRGWIE